MNRFILLFENIFKMPCSHKIFRKTFLILIFLIVLLPSWVLGYEDAAHQDIATKALQLLYDDVNLEAMKNELNIYRQDIIDGSTKPDHYMFRKSINDWEDDQFAPRDHFWNPYEPWSTIAPGVKTAFEKAKEYYDLALEKYRSGEKNKAYQLLGGVGHLLADMAVPAHVHLDPHWPDFLAGKDSYEEYATQKHSLWSDASNIAEPVVLYAEDLFTSLAIHTAQFPSDNRNGKEEAYNNWRQFDILGDDYINIEHLETMGKDLFPHAIKYTAALYKIFWKELNPVIEGSSYVRVLDSTAFSGVWIRAPEGTSWEWDFDYDGNAENFESQSTGQSVQYTYKYADGNGSHKTVALKVTAPGQAPVIITKTIYVAPPTITVEYPKGFESLERRFSTLNKTCGVSSIPCVTQYTWNYGDGVTETDDDNTKTHTYASSGAYEVTVTLTLDDGSSVTGSTSIFVGPGTRYINGHTIYGEETWYSGGTYVVNGTISVAQGATLTIEPGTIVKLANYAGIYVAGTLKADGTAEHPIVFTSVWDGDFGGDTDPNNYGANYPTSPGLHSYTDGSGSANTAYNVWGAIYFQSTSTNSVIDHAIIRYGGYYYGYALYSSSSSLTISQSEISHSMYFGVSIENASPTLTGNTITANAGYGIQINSSSAIITGNTISNNGNYGIYVSTSSPIITGNTISGNAGGAAYFDNASSVAGVGENTITGNTPNNGIWIGGGILARDMTLTAAGGPYIISGMTVPEGVTLTIEPGTVVKFYNSSSSIFVQGTLLADGTAEHPIVFTSVWDNDFGGDTDPNNYGENYPTSPGLHSYTDGSGSANTAYNVWGAIYFQSTSTNSVIDHAIIRYGGYYYGYALYSSSSSLTISQSEISHSMYFGVSIENASPTLTGNTITANAGYGIQINSSSAIITGNTISNNGNYGIYVSTSSPIITGNTISGNAGGAAYFDGASSLAGVGENTITGNIPNNGIWIGGGTLARNMTLSAAGGPYIISGIDVPEGVTLTIEPGAVVKFENGAYINVNGTLLADGTAEHPIVFTSVWDNDFGGDTDLANYYGEGHPTLPGIHSYTDGSGNTAYNVWSAIYFQSTSTNSVIDHAIIRYGGYNYGYTLYSSSSSLTISQSEISHSMYFGVFIENASPTLTGNTITANAIYGIYLSSSSAIITGNTISNNGNYGIYVINTSSPTISGNTISGNNDYGLYYQYNGNILNATNNNWGDPSGPLDDSDDRASGGFYNPNGQGNRVSDYVNYNPWIGKSQLPPVIPTPPTFGAIGDSITINGSNFGAVRGSGYVDFNGIHGTIVSWSDTQIVVTVPTGATSGCLKIVTDSGESDCINFIIPRMLYASFAGAGIWNWDGTDWSQVTSSNPDLLVTVGADLYGTFPGMGIWKYNGTDWVQTTTSVPEEIVGTATTLYGTFTGLGIWEWNGTAWSQTTPSIPQSIIASTSDLYGTFEGMGIWKWDGSAWSNLTTSIPDILVTSGVKLYGTFPGAGIWLWDGTQWTQATGNTPQRIAGNSTTLYGAFEGAGIWSWAGSDWTQISADTPTQMVASEDALYAVFAGVGIRKWDGTNWTTISGNEPVKMVVGN